MAGGEKKIPYQICSIDRVTKTDPQHNRSFGVNLTRGGRAGWVPTSFLKRNADEDKLVVPAPASPTIDDEDEPTNYSTNITEKFATLSFASGGSGSGNKKNSSLDLAELDDTIGKYFFLIDF